MINLNDFKKFVKDELIIHYKINDGFNSTKLRKSWFINNGFVEYYNYIFQKTIFLDESHKIAERIYCILHEIKERPRCIMCDDFCTFKTYHDSYRNNCGKPKCYVHLKGIIKDENGLTANERSGISASQFQGRISENGKTVASNRMKEIHKRRKNIIDPMSRKNLTQLIIEKSARTSKNTVCDNGLTIAQNGAIKSSKTQKSVTINGETIKQRRLRNMRISKRKIGKDGLDSYERGFLNGAGKNSSIKYYDTGLYYQGTYEKHFLDFMKRIGKINQINRGARISYIYDKKKSVYRSDFRMQNIIFEIKSNWTYYGKNKSKMVRNNVKFKSTVENGYRLIIVYNKSVLFEIKIDTFNSKTIYDNLLEKKNGLKFNKENLTDLINEEGITG